MKDLNIISYCSIRRNTILVNGREVFSGGLAEMPAEFLKQAYKWLSIKYPKFYKMDLYSKLAIVAADVLIAGTPGFHDCDPAGTGVVLSNASASLDTDKRHQQTIASANGWFPSPAVFVYTLPNIMIGEICIKHQITGEQMFFVSREFDPVLLANYINTLFEGSLVDQCLGGWIDAAPGDNNCSAFLFIVNRGNNISFTAENLAKLYNS